MLYRKFGKTNEEVSVLGFGCMRLHVFNGNPTKVECGNCEEYCP